MKLVEKYEKLKQIHSYFHIGYANLLYRYFFKRKRAVDLSLNGKLIHISFTNLYFLTRLLSEKWEILDVDESFLTLKSKEGIVLKCRTVIGWDLGHIIEIYTDNAYNADVANKNVIDVGMSNGDSVLYFAKNGAKLVIGIEPDKKSFDLAVENIKASNLNERIIPLNKALSTEKGKTRLFVYENSPNGNSIDMGNMVKLNDSKYEEIVETISLSDVIEMLKGEEIGLLKMDCEGCEYKVLNNFDQNLYNKIENIYLEYHNGLQNLQSLLQTMGFSVEVFGNKEHLGYIKARKIK